eukprot:m.156501 g.156501  ORF g.156501 m.156501 type:complete len:397 (-) comp30998_c0_seq1:333-1523(-)
MSTTTTVVKTKGWADGTAPEGGLCTDAPPFTKADLKAAIPEHCFVKSTLTSLRYTAQDLIICSFLAYLATFIDTDAVPSSLRFILWPTYWWWQGAFFTGLWVIAHECGHRAFSPNKHFGDAVGWVLHSFLLVPYHSWRISHSKHHRSTNDMERDEVFIPYTLSEYEGADVNPADHVAGPLSAVIRVSQIIKMLVFGWPAYLAYHVTGRRYAERTSHFEPSAPLFGPKDYSEVVFSDVGLAIVLTGHAYFVSQFGLWAFVKYYFVPYLFTNMWLVLYTDLQHTDVKLPHYRGAAWSWLKGAICTIDRNYGIYNVIHHHIGDTHVCHHLFSEMPHYNAEEATEAIKPVLGKYYLIDNKTPGIVGICEALWETASNCRYVSDEGDTLWWHRARETPKTK